MMLNQDCAATFAHLLYDGCGKYVGIAKIRASLRSLGVEAEMIGGEYVTDVFDSSENPVMVVKGTGTGLRLFVESLPSNAR